MKVIKLLNKIRSLAAVYGDPPILIMWTLGFSCGVPLLLTASTFALWLKQDGVTYTKIGLMALCALPYTLKFLWAPFLDYLTIPYLTRRLGQRRSWLLISQISLMISLFCISLLNPSQCLTVTMLLAAWIAFSSATQDILMLAYQVERLGQRQYGAGEAMGIFGYRAGLLTAGAGALYLAEFISWNTVYQIMASLIIVGIITTLCIQEPQRSPIAKPDFNHRPTTRAQRIKLWLHHYVILPFSDFTQRNNWVLAIAIMFLYKLSDNLIGNMSNIFFTEIGFTKTEIASASKVFGMINSIVGGFIGGLLILRLGLIKSLFISALIHAISIFFYVIMDHIGPNISFLYLSIAIEHITGGMRTVALFAYQMTLVNPRYAATQLALLTSIVHMGRTYIASLSGFLVTYLGWSLFFTVSALATLISLILVKRLEHDDRLLLRLKNDNLKHYDT